MKKTIISFLIVLIPLSASAEIGIASYYGKQFHGRKTANGEKFDMHALTAAHKYLPFNTMITVTNLSNNSSVRVRINDRGPFVKGRIIDLSKKAAKSIGINGVAKVKIDVIDTES